MPVKIPTVLKITLLILNFFLILVGIAVFRAFVLYDDGILEMCSAKDEDFISDKRNLSFRLSEALRFETVNYGIQDYNREALANFGDYISKSFPRVHSSPIVSKEIVNNLSLLFHIQGSDKTLKPYLLAGHLDVVPVEESYWQHAPFSGIIKDGYVWGRGSMDCKHLVMGILEALEFLFEQNYQPKRSFYLAFGHDEESNGVDGAQHISELLRSRNIQLEYILDEGTLIVDKMIPGVKHPVAFIGVSEKGSLNLELKVTSSPGHSSTPSKETAIVILAKAVSKLEGNMFPSMFGKGPEAQMFEEMASCASFPFRVVFRNLWLFKPFLIGYMTDPVMNAMHRTTTAVTVISGGTKLNVLPSSATAQVNLRVHPAQTNEEATDYVKKVVNDDRVKIKVLSEYPPHPISSINTFGYSTVKNTVRQMYNDSCVVPVTLIANTDTKWYIGLTDSIYRFSLIRVFPQDIKRIHGHNERIAVDNYVKLVNFFVHLVKNSDEGIVEKHKHDDL